MDYRELGHPCVVGLQWGDEGKGKIVDVLVEHFDVAARYSGGANAGHTVVVGETEFALHQLPSAILRENVLCMITCGAVIDPAVLLGEIGSLRERGIAIGDNLRISNRAHLVLPYHRREDVLSERAAQAGEKLGTTARGIGPCFADKATRRWSVRVCDLFRPERLRQHIADVVARKNAYFAVLYDQREPLDAARIAEEYLELGEQLRPFVCDTDVLLHDLMAQGKRVLFEGAQGVLLDIDHGTYPYVTSSHTGVGGVVSGAGVAPATIGAVVGVIKAYATRVGAGPFPTELPGALGETIRQRGGEYGTTTGRPRRCGWFDAVAAGYAAMISGPSMLAVMHLDTLSGMEELQFCVGYRTPAGILNEFPADAYTLGEAEPIYEPVAGWNDDISHCRRLEELPAAARAYLDLISTRLNTPVGIIGVGRDREQTIFVESES
ncbi:MAG: adenylosuccinate synthase [Planctomycetes bacterium]|nr:adenylosuccinate synthase [Planctomycetota bacterium]